MIGRLIVTSTIEYQVITYTVPTGGSQPYDLVYADDVIWFTERAGSKIGRLDPAIGATSEFTIPTSSSQPTGIDIAPDDPKRIWFIEQSGDKLGQLVVTSTTDYAIIEYPLPASYPNAQPQDICVQNSDSIWFTAPGANRIFNFKPSYWPWNSAFASVYTGGGSQPWAIKVDAAGYPWFTERIGNRIGQFFPQTIAYINWHTLAFVNSVPHDLDVAQGFVWFTERDGNRVGRLQPGTGAMHEFGLAAGSTPLGLAVDGIGCAWIAENGSSKIASWCPPYFRLVYLPAILRH
jgi:virginiamycin B lyase